MMQSARKLILVDENDREYKRLQRPTNAVAKTKHSLEVSNTLRDNTLADDQKVWEYVAALHRYLNLRKQVPVEPSVQVNPITVVPPTPPPPPPPPSESPIRSPSPTIRRRGRRRRKQSLAGSPFWHGDRVLRLEICRKFRRIEQSASLRRSNPFCERISGRTRFLHVTQAEETAVSSSQDLLERHRGPLSDGFGGCVRSIVTRHTSRYLLTCIDVFSKRAWAVLVRRKTGQKVAKAFEKILADGNCNMMQSDKGTEFLNSTFQSMLRRRGIKFYTSENEDLKAAVVERYSHWRCLLKFCMLFLYYSGS